MTDQELLELAAKAAGIKIDKSEFNGGGRGNTGFDILGNAVLDWYNGKTWNPLTNDGDAFRLAFVVGLKVDAAKREVWYCKTPALGKWRSIGWDGGIEGLRRAIVLAAAELGREKENSHG
ncbi:hypothetical protein [Pseudomonas sp. W2Jun17]|uniref:hypothetical protein n=1 Tax=Pseudomonas sp. W2Jun17 TaxID=1553460 RepID=UPI002002BF3D|nr:hypothetical protein [Pseudomonas sp. W2Jun17]MCK3849955.1 hypothetical protein [Pseudomonas sp. W2Jun17]